MYYWLAVVIYMNSSWFCSLGKVWRRGKTNDFQIFLACGSFTCSSTDVVSYQYSCQIHAASKSFMREFWKKRVLDTYQCFLNSRKFFIGIAKSTRIWYVCRVVREQETQGCMNQPQWMWICVFAFFTMLKTYHTLVALSAIHRARFSIQIKIQSRSTVYTNNARNSLESRENFHHVMNWNEILTSTQS